MRLAALPGLLVAGILAPGMRLAASTIMRLGVVLLGLSVTSEAVTSLGWSVLLLVVARREEIAYAVGLVTQCGTLSVVLPPLLQDPLGLGDAAFGVGRLCRARHRAGRGRCRAGGTGQDSVTTAMVVKLVRASLLAVLVTVLATSGGRAGPRGHLRGLPPFVLAFVVAAATAAAGVGPAPVLDLATPLRTALLAVGMVGLDSAVRLQDLRRLGLRPLGPGLVSWAVLMGGTLLGVKAVVG